MTTTVKSQTVYSGMIVMVIAMVTVTKADACGLANVVAGAGEAIFVSVCGCKQSDGHRRLSSDTEFRMQQLFVLGFTVKRQKAVHDAMVAEYWRRRKQRDSNVVVTGEVSLSLLPRVLAF